MAHWMKNHKEDLRYNRNFNIYKGALYENVVSDMLKKQGFPLFFYKNGTSTVEMDFMVRDIDSLVPVEVKANRGAAISLNKMITGKSYGDIHYGIKVGNLNIGYNGSVLYFSLLPHIPPETIPCTPKGDIP